MLLVVPGNVSDVRIGSITSKSVVVSWSAPDCRQRNGPSAGYYCELIQQGSALDVHGSHDVETTHSVQTSHEDGNVIHHQVTNDTQLQLSHLLPFTRYLFAVSFRNSDFDGSKTFINFTTSEDGLWITVLAIDIVALLDE